MIFEKKIIQSCIADIEYKTKEWYGLLSEVPNYNNRPVDIVQMCKYSESNWLFELTYLDTYEIEEDIQHKEITALHLDKDDWKKIDKTQKIDIKSKVKKKNNKNSNQPENGLPNLNNLPPNITVEWL